MVNQKNNEPGSKNPVGAPLVSTTSIALCLGLTVPNKFIIKINFDSILSANLGWCPVTKKSNFKLVN